MKVFLSWSGKKSHAAAKVFHDWLPDVVQQIEPWLSTESIEKGESWLGAIRDALQSSDGAGVFFLTREAMTSGWLMFEAGGIAAAIGSSRVCTVCVGIETRDVQPPLSFFQTTQLNSEDVLRLVKTLNARCVPQLDNARLEKSFEKSWPELEEKIKGVLSLQETVAPEPKSTDPVSRSLERILDGQHRLEARLGALEQRQATPPPPGEAAPFFRISDLRATPDLTLVRPDSDEKAFVYVKNTDGTLAKLWPRPAEPTAPAKKNPNNRQPKKK